MGEVDPSKLSHRGRLNFLAKDSVLYGGAAALNRLFSLITFPILARHFSVSDYGLIDLFMVFTNFLVVFIVFGQDSAVARYFYEYKNDESRRELISQSLLIQVGLLVFFLPLLWFGAGKISVLISDSEVSETIFKLNLLQIPCLVLINYSQNLLKWTFSRIKFLSISVGYVMVNSLLLLVGIFFLNIEIHGVFVVSLATQFIFAIIGVIFIKKWLVLPRDLQFMRDLIKYAGPYGLVCCLGAFVPTMERSMVSNLLGDHDLGLYVAGSKVAMVTSLFVQSFQIAWGPFSLAIYAEHDSIRTYNWVLKIFTLLICVIVLFVSAVAEPVLNILTTNRYQGASIVVFPLAMGLAIQAIGWVTGIGISISKKSSLSLYEYSIFLLVSSFSVYFFAKSYGLVGVAYGVMIGYLTKTFTSTCLAQHAYPMQWHFRPTIYIILCTIGFGSIASVVNSRNFFPMLDPCVNILGVCVLLFVGWKVLLETEERIEVLNRIRK